MTRHFGLRKGVSGVLLVFDSHPYHRDVYMFMMKVNAVQPMGVNRGK